MASTLVTFALSSVKPPHASYYGDIDDSNPVVSAANKELKEIMAYFSKKASGVVITGEACSRGPNWLFDIWNKYEPRFPPLFFYKKLIEVGDFLVGVGAYDVANRQCYIRYLVTRYNEVPSDHFENPLSYKQTFFKTDETKDDHILTAKALLGMYISDFYSIAVKDPNLLDAESVPQCTLILKGIRTLMQCLMVNESFCWLVYNCTIIMYTICRALMTASYSIKAIDYLLWASMCMETVVPLLGVKYLQWRVTLYSAVCMAYYDCKAGSHAENFARRGLSKLQELSELERLSDSSYSIETQRIFRQATAKMASMVFKRTVYETRRKQKGVLRPKVRPSMKDMAQMAWPRTVTEKLLCEMFEGSAAQFLAILEALTSSHSRTFHNAPYSTETEIVEVASELFYAGKEIIAGGGGTTNAIASGTDHSVLAGVQNNMSLLELATAGLDGVTLSSVVRFIKLAFCYDMWTIFDSMLDCTLIYVKKNTIQTEENDQGSGHSGMELCLALMLVMQRVTRQQSGRKIGSGLANGPEDPNERFSSVQTMATSSPNVQINDDLVNLAETVLYCINEPEVFKPQGSDGEILIDKDMMMDAAMILWQKCKQAIGKLPSSSKKDFGSSIFKTGDPERWLHILTVVHTALLWCDVGLVDPAVIAEVSLRLAASLESAAASDNIGSRASELRGPSRMAVYSTTLINPNAQLVKSLDVLKAGLKVISVGRYNDAMNDGKSVADTLWINRAEQLAECKVSTANAFIRDLIVEMLVVYYRVSFRLVEKAPEKATTVRSRYNTPRATPSKTAANKESMIVLTEKKIKDTVGGSLICRAIYLMEKANQPGVSRFQAEKFLEKSMKAIEDAQEEEKRLFEESWMQLNNPYDASDQGDLPPPPILLSRSDKTMTFKPAPFEPERDEVAWYKIFGRLAVGPNVKVRLNDYYLPGTGDEVPSGKGCLLRVSGLKRNQRYVFAVAAYTSDGILIGNSVGQTGNSIVASHPLSCLATWGHLAHMSHKLRCPTISKKACSVLWDIFVAHPNDPPSSSWTSTVRQDYEFTVSHLNREVAMESSPVLLHHALTAVFVAVEAAVREKELYCDKFCEEGPILESQINRLKECERMLVAIEMAGWLNDMPLVLQAVVQTYGLIAPIIQAEIMTLPVLRVSLRCICALLETRALLKQKRSGNASDALNHMVAVLTNYIASYARMKGNQQAALSTIDNGKTLLRGDAVALPGRQQSVADQHSGKKRNKKAQAAEPLSEKSVSSLAELAALEDRLADMAKDTRFPDEMTGMEEGNVVATKLAKMRSMVGFREVAKFKRRSRYLEFFVIVLRKALKTLSVEVAVECSQDVMTTLHRRNESLAVNQAVVSKQPGGVAVQGTESRKYAAAVAEYAMDGKKGKKDASLKTKSTKSKKLSPKRKRKGSAGEDSEAAARKNAMINLANHLGKYFRKYQKKKRFRKVLHDETAQKTEFNLLNGLLHFTIFMGDVKDRRSARGFKLAAPRNFEFLDQEWWSLNNSGTLVVGWDDGTRSSAEVGTAAKEESKSHDRALEKAAIVAISSTLVSDPTKAHSPVFEEDRKLDTPRTQQTRSTSAASRTADQEAWIALDMDTFLPPIKLSVLCFQRAMVLAYRGKSWTLLQNTASNFYAVAMAIYQVACDGTEPQFTLKECRELLRVPMFMAADLLIGVLMATDVGGGDGPWLYHSAVGEKKAKKGGLSLKFEKPEDDICFVNVNLIKRIVFQAIEILHHCKRYEQLIDLCLRFTEVTHACYYDVISPLVIHAQSKLSERIREFEGTPHPQEHMLQAAKKLGKYQVENSDYLRFDMKVKRREEKEKLDVGGFIDPESHDVYSGGKRALALSSVPFDSKHSMEKLKEAFYGSQYTTRALQYCRRMLLVYIASQHNAAVSIKKGSGKKPTESMSGSCVEFSLKADESHPPAPHDLSAIDFKSTDAVEILASPQSSNVIQAYHRTIELLQSHGEHDLVSQASNELANLYLHLGNVKSAFKWWKHSLDEVLGTKNSLNEWRKPFEHDENAPAELLATCGVWGCLHAINVACKIGEFSSPDTDIRTECALLSTALVRAIFRSSMPHPTADFDYATFEILPSSFQNALITQSKTKVTLTSSHLLANTLLAGVDFFSDNFRLDVQSLVASLHWLCDYLVQMKFHLPALPATVLYQYFATFICRDTERSAYCRCIKLNALTELRMFKEASEEIMNLLCGARLPHPTDVGFAPAEPFPVPNYFNVAKPIHDDDNLKIMEIIAGKRISEAMSQTYGPHLTCEITLCQANLLVQLSACISCIPQKPTLQDLQFVSPELPERTTPKKALSNLTTPSSKMKGRRQSSNIGDDTRSTISALSSIGGAKNVSKLFTKRERPMGLQLLKGMLLAVAEHLITTLAKPLESSSDSLLASEVWFFVKCLHALSDIQLQRQLSTLSAAKAFHALSVLQEASIFDESSELKIPKPRSAMRGRRATGDKKKSADKKSDFYPVTEQLYRSRLNSRLWLDCRLKMCQALTTQVKGLGKIEDNLPQSTGLLDHSQVQIYCAEGLAESEACNDVEMQALFLLQGASLDGITSSESKHMLEDATTSLDEQAELSSRAVMALVESTVLLADVSISSGFAGLSDSLQSYRSAQSVLLLKAMQEGEVIRHYQMGSDLSNLEEHPSNIFSSTVLLLAQIKLRIARTLAQTLEYERIGQDYTVLAQILSQAENICSLSAFSSPLLLAEINLELGKAQKILFGANIIAIKPAMSALKKAISLAEENACDLSLMRQAHLESALLHLINIEEQTQAVTLPSNLERATTSFPAIKEEGLENVNMATRSLSLDCGVVSQPLEVTNSKDRIATSLHISYFAAKNLKERCLLPGDPKITSLKLSSDDKVALPDFLVLDLASDLSSFPKTISTGDDAIDPVTSLKTSSTNISWIHIFMYNVLLQRKSRLSTSLARENTLDLFTQNQAGSDDASPANEGRCTAVRTPLKSADIFIRLAAMHGYLTRHSSYEASVEIPILSAGTSFVVSQWYWSDDRSSVQLLWCVQRKDGTADCGKIPANPKLLERITQQATETKKRTDEFFARHAPVTTPGTTPRRKSRAKSIQVDPQLEEDWTHVVNQIISLLSNRDDLISSLPFSVTLVAAESIVEFFNIGCFFDSSHSLHSWMSKLLCPV